MRELKLKECLLSSLHVLVKWPRFFSSICSVGKYVYTSSNCVMDGRTAFFLCFLSAFLANLDLIAKLLIKQLKLFKKTKQGGPSK